jgi:hypothetical protein
MAKKKSTKRKASTEGKVPPGHRRCPYCKAVFAGPRKPICPECNHSLNVRKKTGEATTQKQKSSGKNGGASAHSIIAQMEKARALAEMLGGSDRAEQILTLIETIGSVQDARLLLDYHFQEKGQSQGG